MATKDPVLTIRAKDKTKRAFRSVRRALGGLRKAVFSAKGAITALVGAAGFGLLIKRSFKLTDALAKTADKLGITTENLAALQHAGELTGVSTQNMNLALQRLTRRAAEAAQGTGEAVKALAELNINAVEFNKLPLEEQMFELADAMGTVENQADRVRIAFKLFDTEGVNLVNTLGQGKGALKDMMAEAQALGLAVNRVDAAKIEMANDAFTRIKGVVSGVANTIAVQLAPFLQVIADMLVNASIESEGFKGIILSGIESIVRGVGFMADAFRGLQLVWGTLKVVFVSLASFIVDKFASIDNTITSFLNKLPFVTATVSQTIIDMSATLSETVNTTMADFAILLEKPWPSTAVDTFFANVEAKSIAAAKVIAAQQGKMIKGNKSAGDALNKQEKFASGQSFKLSKELNVARTIANLPAAVSGAYKVGADIGGPIVGAAFAASAALFETRQIAAAKGSSLGGGGGGGGGASAPTVPAFPPAELNPIPPPTGPTEVSIIVDGTGKLDRDQAQEIADSLKELLQDGGTALI